jgi:hypothetical protein
MELEYCSNYGSITIGLTGTTATIDEMSNPRRESAATIAIRHLRGAMPRIGLASS